MLCWSGEEEGVSALLWEGVGWDTESRVGSKFFKLSLLISMRKFMVTVFIGRSGNLGLGMRCSSAGDQLSSLCLSLSALGH